MHIFLSMKRELPGQRPLPMPSIVEAPHWM